MPRMFTVRALVLFVVGMLAFVLLFPTVRAYVAQRSDNASLAQQVAQARAQNKDLEGELERWNDPAYVAAQARERLAFVRPGETAFRVVDPQTVPNPNGSDVVASGSGPARVPEGSTKPWYNTVWESVRVAGDAKVGQHGATTPAVPLAPTVKPLP
jgi:cell division protein FtsB